MQRATANYRTHLPLLSAQHSGRAVSHSLFRRGRRICLQPAPLEKDSDSGRASELTAFLSIAGQLSASDRKALLAHFLGATNAEVGRHAGIHRAHVPKYVEQLLNIVRVLGLARSQAIGDCVVERGVLSVNRFKKGDVV